VRIDTSGTHCQFTSRAAGYRHCRGRGGRTLRSRGVGRSAYRARVRWQGRFRTENDDGCTICRGVPRRGGAGVREDGCSESQGREW